MHRGLHFGVALLAVFLLMRPLDCLSGGKFDRKAADCCKKGKCDPSNSDDCCKARVSGGSQLLKAQALDESAPELGIAVDVPATGLQLSSTFILVVGIHQPLVRPPDLRSSLPLLI